MRTINHDLLRDLAGYEAPLCLSLFLEVAVGGGDHKHVRASLKNAQSEAARLIDAVGTDDPAVAAVRDRLDALDYADVAGGHDRRVAVFIAPDLTEVIDARFVETGVHAGTRFRLAPLLHDLEHTPEHAILVATQDEADLYRVSGGDLIRQTVPGMPGSISEVNRFTDQQEKGNIHGREDSGISGAYKGPQATDTGTSGPQGVPHHSVGGHDWREDKESDLRSYANLLVNAAQHHLSGTSMPLVIVADERLNGMIRENSEYPFLADEGVTIHPKNLSEDDLREKAAACVGGQTAKARDDAWDKVAMSLGRDDHEASDDPADIATSAAAGRIAQLFVRAGSTLRGRINDRTLTAERDEAGAEDLVDLAISGTLRNGGEVFPLGDRGGGDMVMAAAYRYPA